MRARLRELLDDESGFTLVELAVAMPIMLVVVGGMVLVLTTLTHVSSQNQEKLTLQTEARSALNRMETEVRGAFYGDGVTTPISAGTATSITFTTPDEYATSVSGSTLSTFHLQQISYQVASKLLQRQFRTTSNVYPAGPPWTFPGSMSTWTTVVGSAGSVTNTDVFSFYTQAGCQATPPTAMSFPLATTNGIQCVGVKLTLATVGGGNGVTQPDSFTVTDLIAIRGNA
jgi:type II secretory pathway component PulJ